MTDLTEQLAKLAELRDKGVLTELEFEQQKALLLNPPAAAAAPPTPSPAPYVVPAADPAANNKTMLFALGGGALVIVVLVALWATGVFAKMGMGSAPFGNSSTTTIASSQFGASNGTAPVTMPTAFPTPAAAPTNSAPGTDVMNPMLGEWVADTGQGDKCPTRVMFADTYLIMSGMKDGQPQTKQAAVAYNVENTGTVGVTVNGESETAHIAGSHMTLDECSFTKSGGDNTDSM